MKYIYSLLVMVTTTFACSDYTHAEWKLVNGNNKFNYYYDSFTIHKIENIARVWALYDHSQLFTSHNVKPYMSMMVLGEFDCNKKTHRTLYSSTHSKGMGRGEMIEKNKNHKFTGKWHSVPPATSFYTLMRIACK